ncbi:UNVERIFIED_CONTAM: M81 family metallopeptidase [Microbacterium sp. SLM126]
MRPRFAIVGAWHETNTYASTSTTIADFEHLELASGVDLAERNVGKGTVIGGFLSSDAADMAPVFAASSWPSGPVDEGALDHILARIEEGLRQTGPIDGVLVNLHGAMVASKTADVEAAVLQVIRDTRPGAAIGAVLDLHANPSAELVSLGDVFVSYDTFPHVDMFERGREVAALLARSVTHAPLRTSIRKVPLLVNPIAQSTDAGPLADVQARARTHAANAGVVRVSVTGGFAFSDVDRAGMSVLSVHEESQPAEAVLDSVVDDIRDRASDFVVGRDDPATAVRRALESAAHPVFLVDVADNIGGGSPGDGTALLRELLTASAPSAVVTIADRDVALAAHEAGVGARMDVTIGGKTDRMHGDPVRVRVEVDRLTDGVYRSGGYYMNGMSFSMGRTARLRSGGVTIVVTEFPTPAFHSEQLTSVGIDPSRFDIVVMKGALAWREAFAGIPREIIEVATPGICPVDVSSLPRRTTPVTL